MNLKNKNIAEGMRVMNGKNELKVVSWDKSYNDCLLKYLDSKGNRYVIAEHYELSGTEKDPQISWMNGRYFTANSDDEALEEYLDYLGEVNEYDISESLKESKEFFVGSKTWQGYDVYMIEDGKKYYLSKLAKNIEDSSWSSDFTYAKHWKDESRAEEIVDMLNSELKESKKSFKERSEENEIIVSELQDTVEYFCGLYEENKELKGRALESLKNAVERLEVFNAIGSIYQWGVEVLNKCGIKYKGLKESKKVMNEKVDSRYKYAFNHTKDEYEIVQFDDYNFEILAIPNDKSIFSDDLPKFKIEKTYIYDTCVNNRDITLFVGIVEELGWCFIAFDKLANNNNIFAYFISGKTKEGAYHSFHEYKSEYNLRCEESKKSARKSLKESAKPINEKNVAKFVDEVNKWCDDNIHYVDMDAENFTKKYGKIYNFKYRKEGDFFVIYDSEGTLDLFDREASLVYPTLDKLAKKNGWYIDPYSCACDFTFGEL